MQRVVGYIRVSTDEQHLSPVSQRNALESWCTEHKAELVAVFDDIAVSGGAPIDKRPGLMAAIEALSEHKASALLVAKRDRLARDTMAAAMIERLAERAGARILATDGTGNEDSPEGLLMRRMVDAFAEYERAIIKARIKAALAVKKARSERVGSVPYGFTVAGDGRHLVMDKSEQAAVTLVRQAAGKGTSLRSIAAQLDAQGIRPRSGGSWHPQTIQRIIAAREPGQWR